MRKMLALILLSQIAVFIAARQCDINKIAIAGGEYHLTNETNVGSKVEYTCPEGTYLHPLSSQECLSSGRWSNEKVKAQCKAVQCPRPVMFESGELYPRKVKYFVGDVLHFKCWGGFRMFGPENRTCQENGKWSGEETKCDDQVGDCPNPGIPIGATKVGTSYMAEDKVTYHCENGLKMFGSKERVCQENKRWSGAEPSCRYWYTYDTPKEVAETLSASLSETIESSDPDKVEDETDRTIKVEKEGHMNIFIVIDTSRSVGPNNFNTAKEIGKVFIEKMASFDFVPRYAAISYASYSKVIVALSDDESTDAGAVIERIDRFQYTAHKDKQRTNTRAALNDVYKMLSLEHVRDPKKFMETRNVILLMTDGEHNMGGDPTVEIKKIKELLDISKDDRREDFLDVYAFGLGYEISENNLNDIASKKNREIHVFKMRSIDDMKRAFDYMLEESEIFQMCGLSSAPVRTQDNDYDNEYRVDPEETYPWIAKITITRPGSQEICKGSIVSKFTILTAASCFHLDEALHSISVEVGDRKFSVKNLHRHSDYNPAGKTDKNVRWSFDYDLALLEIKGNLVFSRKVRPICLPCTTGTSWALKQRGKSVTCSDHEKTLLSSDLVRAMFVAEERPKQFEQKDVLIKQGIKRLACLDDAKKTRGLQDIPNIKDLITDNFLCTGGVEPQVDPQTCPGDTGGPLIVPYKQRFIQVGIISWGNINSCHGRKRSPDPVPAMSRDFHTNLFHMMNWLKEKLKEELEFLN